MVELQEDLFPELDRCLSLYMAEYRALLLEEESAHAFVFVNAKGEAFKSSAFSEYLGRLLTRLTGRKATSNIMRSSFVTNLMETNPSDSEKTSAQSLLRHSERKQAEVYDRRGERSVSFCDYFDGCGGSSCAEEDCGAAAVFHCGSKEIARKRQSC